LDPDNCARAPSAAPLCPLASKPTATRLCTVCRAALSATPLNGMCVPAAAPLCHRSVCRRRPTTARVRAPSAAPLCPPHRPTAKCVCGPPLDRAACRPPLRRSNRRSPTGSRSRRSDRTRSTCVPRISRAAASRSRRFVRARAARRVHAGRASVGRASRAAPRRAACAAAGGGEEGERGEASGRTRRRATGPRPNAAACHFATRQRVVVCERAGVHRVDSATATRARLQRRRHAVARSSLSAAAARRPLRPPRRRRHCHRRTSSIVRSFGLPPTDLPAVLRRRLHDRDVTAV
jgi:hypothetical protein